MPESLHRFTVYGVLLKTVRQPAYLPLDGDTRDVVGRLPGLKVEAAGGRFAPGVRGTGWAGPLTLSAPSLLHLREGSVEFWLQPQGVNNYALMTPTGKSPTIARTGRFYPREASTSNLPTP